MDNIIIELLADRVFVFFIGGIVGFALAAYILHKGKELNEEVPEPEEIEEDDDMDGEGYCYYMKLPNGNIELVEIEEEIGLDHKITLEDKKKYKVIGIDHKVNTHTICTLGYEN